MLKFLADENFNNDIVRGILRLNPQIDIIRVQDAFLRGADDPKVLDWAAKEGRVLLTHDVKTMPTFAYDRVDAGLSMPGVIEVHEDISMARIIEDILILAECSRDDEWEGQVIYVPLQ